MIALLRGTLVERSPSGEVILDVSGVGYQAMVSPATFSSLGVPGATVVLHTHLHVREDALTLYGFLHREERACFEALIGAHGVGPALAMAILSVHSPDHLRRAVADDDVDALCLVPGVGRKTAARLLIDLKSRLDLPDTEVSSAVLAAANGNGNGAGVSGPSARSEVREALAALGYAPEEVREALRDLPNDGDTSTLVRHALVRMGGR